MEAVERDFAIVIYSMMIELALVLERAKMTMTMRRVVYQRREVVSSIGWPQQLLSCLFFCRQ